MRRIMREDAFFLNSHFEIMPFTLSHTVAVIPLYKYLGKFGALSALVIGSMTPDAAYLVPFLIDQRMNSHSIIGVYLFCIPVGLTIYFLYHLLMAPVIVSILPKFIQKHLDADLFMGRLPNIPSYALLFSIVLGALTHVFWDFFTHNYGIPNYIPWMGTSLTSVDGYNIMPYRILQHFSTLLGLSLLIFWFWKWQYKKNNKVKEDTPKTQVFWQPSANFKRNIIIFLLIASLLAGSFYGFIMMPETTVMYGIYSIQVFVRYAIVGSVAIFLINTLLLGCYYQYKIQSTL